MQNARMLFTTEALTLLVAISLDQGIRGLITAPDGAGDNRHSLVIGQICLHIHGQRLTVFWWLLVILSIRRQAFFPSILTSIEKLIQAASFIFTLDATPPRVPGSSPFDRA